MVTSTIIDSRSVIQTLRLSGTSKGRFGYWICTWPAETTQKSKSTIRIAERCCKSARQTRPVQTSKQRMSVCNPLRVCPRMANAPEEPALPSVRCWSRKTPTTNIHKVLYRVRWCTIAKFGDIFECQRLWSPGMFYLRHGFVFQVFSTIDCFNFFLPSEYIHIVYIFSKSCSDFRMWKIGKLELQEVLCTRSHVNSWRGKLFTTTTQPCTASWKIFKQNCLSLWQGLTRQRKRNSAWNLRMEDVALISQY